MLKGEGGIKWYIHILDFKVWVFVAQLCGRLWKRAFRAKNKNVIGTKRVCRVHST